MRGGISLTTGLVLLELLIVATAHRCDRTPEGHVAPKIPADNRFQLKISGSPEKYVPGTGYTISLYGLRNHGHVPQKFTGFMLVVEPQNYTPLRILSPRDVTSRPVGTFQLEADTLTKFSSTCPNMVTHTSSIPKSEIQVRWNAPPPGSGCVIFRATVIEHRDVWYQDDGPLSKMLCEDVQEGNDTQPQILDTCCACDEAKYEVTFEGLWSRHTHPKDFPSNTWLTKFSDIIGASHSVNYRFWEYGGYATEGLKQVAESGSTRMLETELKNQSQNIRTIIKARGISYPNVTGKTFAVFRVDKDHHLMSLVSMIDPSPDWIVGVSAFELCLPNCSWVESKVHNLYPWDAGTDSGITYISPNQETEPRDKIRQITSSYPNDPRSPFYDPSGAEMKPLARLYLTRQRLYEKTCEEDVAVPGDPCPMSEWSPWGACSATCGLGQMHRQRYALHNKSNRYCPNKPLTQKKDCMKRQCRFLPTPQEQKEDIVNQHCDVTEWADWSRCEPVDNRCEEGMQKRYRQVRAKSGYPQKYCLNIPTNEDRTCSLSKSYSVCPKNKYGRKPHFKDPQGSTCCEETNGEEEEEKDEEGGNEGEVYKEEGMNNSEKDYGGDGDENNNGGEGGEDKDDGNKDYWDSGTLAPDYETEEPMGECAMTQWSDWSPCSASCGVGETRRVRYLMNSLGGEEEADQGNYRAARETDNDYGTDTEEENGDEYGEGPCSIYKTLEVRPCNGTHPTCQFSPGEARGESEEETVTEEAATEEFGLSSRSLTQEGTDSPVHDCKFSRWSPWSKCDAQCGQRGLKERTRHIVVHAKNGGRDCNGKTRKVKSCIRKCTEDEKDDDYGDERGNNRKHKHKNCHYSEWTDWTDCTATCGYNAVQQRTRLVMGGNTAECSDRLRQRACNVGPCPL